MNVWMRGLLRVFDRFPCPVDVAEVGPGETGDLAVLHGFRNLPYRFEVPFGGDGKTGLDNVDAERLELFRNPKFLLGRFMVFPGDCSPSLRVVSKMRTRSSMLYPRLAQDQIDQSRLILDLRLDGKVKKIILHFHVFDLYCVLLRSHKDFRVAPRSQPSQIPFGVIVMVGKLNGLHQVGPQIAKEIKKGPVVSKAREGKRFLSFHVSVIGHRPSLQTVKTERPVADMKSGDPRSRFLDGSRQLAFVDQHHVGFPYHFKGFSQETERKEVHGVAAFLSVQHEHLHVLSHVPHLVPVIEHRNVDPEFPNSPLYSFFSPLPYQHGEHRPPCKHDRFIPRALRGIPFRINCEDAGQQ